MKFDQTYDFDYGADIIFVMFTDQDYFLGKYERLSGRKPRLIRCTDDGTHFSITVRHVLDAAIFELPELVTKRIGDRLTLHQSDTWQRADQTGRVDIEFEKSPVEIAIDMKLIERKGKARLTLAFDINAQVPLFGKHIEEAIQGPMTRYMQQDLQLSNEMAVAYTDSQTPS